jgi:hypothetical protein
MSVSERPATGSYLAKQLGTMALSQLRTDNPMALVRAAAWHNLLHRLGLSLPLVVVHDLGLLFTTQLARVHGSGRADTGTGTAVLRPRAELDRLGLEAQDRSAVVAYGQVLASLADSEVVAQASSWRLRDELVAVILTKLCDDLYRRWPEPGKGIGAESLPLDPEAYSRLDMTAEFRRFDRRPLFSFLRFLAQNELPLYTQVEQIDLDTLKLMGLFRGGDRLAALDLVDLYQVFQTSSVSDVVRFSLELMPAILETKRARGVQSLAIDGYASVERKGNLDRLVLSELAFDDELFIRKYLDGDLYYYGHERPDEEERKVHYILIDASASMRGVRQVFARGLALTLAKKLALEQQPVWLRFFDSRLYELMRVGPGQFGGAGGSAGAGGALRGRAGGSVAGGAELSVPYLLCFKAERGRNYGKVFRQLLAELVRLKRDERRQIVLYIITHGHCHIPPETVERMREVASLYGIFILPSAGVPLEYLGSLHRYQIVQEESLADTRRRAQRALEIIDDAAGQVRPGVPARPPRPARAAGGEDPP